MTIATNEQSLLGLSVLNHNPPKLPGPGLLHNLVSTYGQDECPALDFLSRHGDILSLSYNQFHAAANALALRIATTLRASSSNNVGARLIIPVLIPQSPQLYIALLAILKVGGAFCPLNLDAPEERVKFILKDVEASLVLVSSELSPKIPKSNGDYETLLLEGGDNQSGQAMSLSYEYRVPQPEDLAYVMYTSGSTGTPKGVAISHSAATQCLLAHDRHIPQFKRFLQFAAPTFDVSVFEIFFPFFRRGTLVCCDRIEMLSDLPRVLRTMKVDACELTPSVAGSLLRKKANAPGLKLLLTIGEMLNDPVVREFGGDPTTNSMLWGMYGPTEATIHCTLQPAFAKASSRTNIGFPLDNVSAYILDIDSESENAVICPIGEVGELAVGGSQLAEGYINRPDQTSRSFVSTPWGPMYRTGDKARMNGDGLIECLGRIDETQVKLNGQRIELGEVEQAILRTENCHGAFASVISNILVAFVAVEGASGMEDRIKSVCKSWLPAFMVPADIVTMPAFPQLPSGKIDRKGLVAQYQKSESDRQRDDNASFQHDTERKICQVASRMLETQVTPTSRLLSSGVDSLGAIKLASMLRAEEIWLSPMEMLSMETFHDIFLLARRKKLAKDASKPPRPVNGVHFGDGLMSRVRKYLARSIDNGELDQISEVYACTPLQQSMVSQTLDDARMYVNQVDLELPHHVSPETARSWLFSLAHQNEILRTGLVNLEDGPYQVVWKKLGGNQVVITPSQKEPESWLDVVDKSVEFLKHPLLVQIQGGCGPTRIRLTLHHAIYDGWTVDLLREDLAGLTFGRALVERPQFHTFSTKVRELSSTGEQTDMAKQFWAEHLRGFAPLPVPNFKTTAVAESRVLQTSNELSICPDSLRSFARNSGISPQVVFQTCLGCLWSAITGADDVVLGSVTSGRHLPLPDIDRIMGPCIATTPLRMSPRQSQTMSELLRLVHIANRESLQHATLPLAEIKKTASLPISAELFNVLFVYQESLASRNSDTFDTIREIGHRDVLEARLLVEIQPLQDRFACHMTWHSDSYSKDQTEMFSKHLGHIIKRVLQGWNGAAVSVCSLLPLESLSRYNISPKTMNIFRGLPELVERNAETYPKNTAVCFANSLQDPLPLDAQYLTYDELNSKANQIARNLQRHGAKKGGIIAIVMEKSPLLYCSILGILKTGSAYLPLLPSTQAMRITSIFQQAEPQLCVVDLTSPSLTSEVFSGPLVNVDADEIFQESTENLGVCTEPEGLAYIIYTSGTTGTPKGVSVTNRNMLSNIAVLSNIYPHSPSDRMLQACSQAFDVSVFEIFFAWGNGMCLCAAVNDILFHDLNKSIRNFGATHLSMTVTVASLIDPDTLPSVTFLVTSGEAMTDEVLGKCAGFLYQGYGPSETTNICTVRKVSRGDSSQYLGWSFENTSAFVMDTEKPELVPLGCLGEFVFGGDQVAAGYLNMPQTTAEKFFDHPEYGRLYRSGDMGRMLPDGSLIILGRKDTQIKLRGLRIELQEIQSITLNTGLASACVVLLVSSGVQHTQQLALFYVSIYESEHGDSKGFHLQELDERQSRVNIQLGQELRSFLPDYMVPSFIFPISRLPQTSSGKVDSGRLRLLVADMSEARLSKYSALAPEADDDSDWTEAEVAVAHALSQVLTISKNTGTGRWTSFAALGMDSILAMPVARKLSDRFGKHIQPSLVLRNPCIARLASAIVSRNTDTPAQETPKALLPADLVDSTKRSFANRHKTVQTILPCTPLQEAMLASSASQQNNAPSYYNQMLFRLERPSQEILKYWSIAFERHQILRTCFATTQDMTIPVVQVVLSQTSLPLVSLEDESLTVEQLASQHMMSLPEAVNSDNPPVSLAAIRTGNAGEFLSFICHHAMYDGISMRNLLSEIETMANHVELPDPVPFEAFLAETLQIPPEADDFWSAAFDDFVPVQFSPPGAEDVKLASTIVRDLSSNLDHIEAGLRSMGATLLSICQASWAISLSMLQGSPDVCFGTIMNGRTVSLENVDRLVAPCFNTVPLRVNLAAQNLCVEAIKKFQGINIDLIPYQFTPLRRIQSKLSPGFHLFQTLLLLQPPYEPMDTSIWSLEKETGAMDVPLVCEITPVKENNKLCLQLHRDPAKISHQTMRLALDIFEMVFTQCLEYPNSRVPTPLKLSSEWQRETATVASGVARNVPHLNGGTSGSQEDMTWSQSELLVRQAISQLANIPDSRVEKQGLIFRYGLDSIGAVQIASSLRQQGYQITAADVLESPTCVGIASRMVPDELSERALEVDFGDFGTAVAKEISRVQLPGRVETILPCSPVQQGMLSQFLESEGKLYLNSVSWSLDAHVDPIQVANAWKQLTTRHQILRSGFAPINHPQASFAMVVYVDGSLPENVLFEQSDSFDLKKWQQNTAEAAFKTVAAPPWGVVVLQNSSGSKQMHLCMHHALYDAHSLRILMRELRAIVDGSQQGQQVTAASRIEAALSHIHQQGASSEHNDFWREKADQIVVNGFPTMTPLREEGRGWLSVSRVCSKERQYLRSGAAQGGVTIQAALQAAWTKILSAYQGEPLVTFGVVLAGRSNEELADAMLPLITTLPVIARDSESTQQLVHDMMEYNRQLHWHEHASLANVQRYVGRPEGSLFDTILVYQTADDDASTMPWQIIEEKATVGYTLSMEAEEVGSDQLQFNLVFNADVLPLEQAEIMLSQFDAIFVDAVCSPNDSGERDASILSILPPAEPEMPAPERLLHQLAERTAHLQPDAVALQFVESLDDTSQHQEWSYRELDAIGNQVAAFLVSQEIPPRSIVAICFDKCPEAYFSIFGILKAGHGFLALDPTAPASRQEFILSDSHASILLTTESMRSNLGFSSPVPVEVISKSMLQSFSTVPQDLPSPILPEDTCYCLYTSGTTGTPKGCLITHDNTVQAMLAFKHLFAGHWDANSRWLQFASLHFDVSVLEQYWSWFVGITLVSAPRDLVLSDLVGTISKLDITHIDLTPSLARLVHPDEVPSLCRGVFITGGEQLRQDVLEAWGPQEVIYNAYGPTEATIGVTMYQKVPRNGRPSNIGRQFPNVGSYIFEPGTETPVLRGAVGELCVSGRLVGKGYLNRHELTETRFPTLSQFGERVYRTGDLVRVLCDGTFDFLGRVDDQVKLRGQRLEIGEINYAIKTGLSQKADVATLVARYGDQDRDMLVSFVAPEIQTEKTGQLHIYSDSTSLEMGLKAQDACRSRLPGYMVPTYVFCVPFIPLSANNKANINSLKQLFNSLTPEELRNLSSSAGPAARRALNEPERNVVKAILQTVQADEVSITPASTIFDLGVDSIIVTRLVRNLRQVGFPSATVSVVLKNARLGRLAQALEAGHPSVPSVETMRVQQSLRAYLPKYLGTVSRALRVDKKAVEYIAPCTPLQEGMLTRARTRDSDDLSAYFNTFKFNLSPEVSAERLKEALLRIVADNAVLRTAFVPTSDGFVQVALRNREQPWSEMELQAGSPTDEVLEKRYDSWVGRNQGVLQDPLELDLIYCDSKPQVLVIRIFHAIYDAHSFDLMLNQLVAHYQGQPITAGAKFVDVLPHGPLSLHSSSRHFWETLFKGTKPQSMPQFAKQPSLSDVVVHRGIPVEGLEDKRKSLGVTHQTMIQAVWFALLSRYFEYPPTVGVIFSGRTIPFPGIENTLGPLFNTLPFTVGAEHHVSTWSSLVAKVHEYNSSVLDFVHVPLRDIQKWCSGGRSLFSVLFSFEKRTKSGTNADSYNLLVEASSKAAADYPLALEAVLTGHGHLELTVVARAGVADEASVLVLLDEFEELTSSLLGSDDMTTIPSDGREPQPTSQKTKGIVHDSPLMPAMESQFHWTEHAMKLRHEMALLAGVADQDVSETTSILELGLDSIDAVKLAARLSKMGPRVATSELMKGLTIYGILQKTGTPTDSPDHIMSEQLRLASDTLKAKLEQSGREVGDYEAILPPTPLQDSMMVEMILSEGHRYFNHEILEVPSGVDMEKLKEAWREVYFHSPILRTTFEEVEDANVNAAFFQVVHKPADAADIVRSGLTIAKLDDIWGYIDQIRVESWEAKGSRHLFHITPVLVGDKNYLVVSIAHALYDGWSLDMLYHDVQASYQGQFSSRLPYEPYLGKIMYGSGQPSVDFWSDFMHDVKPTLLLAPEKDTESYTIHRGSAESHLSPGQIKKLCKRFAITPQVLGQACLAGLLATLTNSLEVTFGVVLSGRDSSDAQEIMFPTMNTVAMRTILHGTVEEFLRYMQDTMSSVMEFQQMPLRKAQQLAGTEGRALFNTLFILQTKKDDETSAPGGGIMKSVNGTSAIEYPFCVEMELTSSSVKWHVALDEQYGFGVSDVNSTLRDLDTILNLISDENTTDLLSFDALGQKASLGSGMKSIDLSREVSIIEPLGTEAAASAPVERTEWTAAEAESPLLYILSQVAGVDKAFIRPQDSVHNIGLDSISMMKVSSLTRKRGVDISTRDLLRATTIRDVIKRINNPAVVVEPHEELALDTFRKLLGEPQCAELAAKAGLHLEQIEFILPTLPVQVHMLSTWQNTNGGLFFPTFTYKLQGDIDLEKVQKVWPLLVTEVPVLRCHFVATKLEKTPVALMVKKPAPEVDSLHSNGMTDAKMDFWAYTNKPTPFVSIHVEKLSSQPATMRLRIHHALYDAISLPMLVQRFEALCNETRAAEFPPSAIQASSEQWFHFVNRGVSSRIQTEKQQFWTQYFEGLEQRPKPIITNGQQQHLSNGARKTQTQDQVTKLLRRSAFDDVAALKTLCARRGISVQSLFFAAYAEVLATEQQHQTCQGNSSAQKDVVFGIYLANRAALLEQPSSIPCPTLNILPLRVRPSNANNNSEETPGVAEPLLQTAVRVQRDLDAIRTNSSATHAGLWEMDQWMGGNTSSPSRIDRFVNFLSSSSSSSSSSPSSSFPPQKARGLENMVQAVLDMPGDDDELSPKVVEQEGLAQPDDEWIEDNTVRECYPAAIDIEVAIREDGSMDIGAFGSPSSSSSSSSSNEFTHDRAEETINQIVQILKSCTREAP